MAFSSEEEQLRKFRNDEIAQHYFEVLRTLISKKSIFAQNIGLYDVAAYLGEIFSGVGAEVTIDETYTAPFVLAKFKSPNPDAKTIIFYQHYDTVPADNDQPWTDEPFRLTVRKGYMYGRGVDDDKGHITARLTALRKYIREVGDLPVNITFMMEGAEESASTDLEKYLEKIRDDFFQQTYWFGSKEIEIVKVNWKSQGATRGLLPLTCLSRVLMLISTLNLVQ